MKNGDDWIDLISVQNYIYIYFERARKMHLEEKYYSYIMCVHLFGCLRLLCVMVLVAFKICVGIKY